MNTLIRVVLCSDGSIHAALETRKSVICTTEGLMCILTDPQGFFEGNYLNYMDSTPDINAGNLAVDDIPGLTLLRVDTDNRIICEYPYLFGLLFEAISRGDSSALYAAKIKLQENLSDEKEFLLSLFQALSELRSSGTFLKRKIQLSEEAQNQILREIINTHFSEISSETVPHRTEETESPEQGFSVLLQTKQSPERSQIPSHYIRLQDYVERNGYEYVTVHGWCRRGKLASAIQDKSKHWWVNPADRPKNLQVGKQKSVNEFGEKMTILREKSYDAVQEYIAKRGLVSPAVSGYIRTYDEIKYYENKNYREVEWDGFSYLIIDINPDYICKSTGKTNRQLIEAGEAPVVPNDEDNSYVLHHVGQKIDSPLAIIPARDHNITSYRVFHQESSDEGDLHGPEFTVRKNVFWNTFLAKYDKYGSFHKIPCVCKVNQKNHSVKKESTLG